MSGIAKAAIPSRRISAYVFYYDMNLFSDFTYYLVDYTKGRPVRPAGQALGGGFDAHHTVFSTWYGRKMSNTFGLQLRNDWINNGLYRAENRVRTAKTDYSASGASFFPTGSSSGPPASPSPTPISLLT